MKNSADHSLHSLAVRFKQFERTKTSGEAPFSALELLINRQATQAMQIKVAVIH